MAEAAKEPGVMLIYLRVVSAGFLERLCWDCDEIADATAVSEDRAIVECYARECLFASKSRNLKEVEGEKCENWPS